MMTSRAKPRRTDRATHHWDRETALVAQFAACVSFISFVYYFQHGGLLLYGDAVAHINIARRVFDSRTPGPLQLGTVWLPLPHVLMIPFLLFDSAWQSGPVQHRGDSDHNVTPTATEMPAEPGSIGSQLTPSQRAELNSRIIPAGGNDLTIDTGATGIGSRWLTFEDRLRQRRRDITHGCTACTTGSASERSESATDVRKAG